MIASRYHASQSFRNCLLLAILANVFAPAIANPEPLPYPLALADPLPVPVPDAAPDPLADGNSVYAPFSGAIYVVGVPQAGNNAQGTYVNTGSQGFTSASPAICPNNAPQGCGNLNIWNWCCPSGYTCAWLSNSVVGCCPSGNSCSNVGNIAAPLATVTQTVQAAAVAYTTYTQVTANPTVVVVAGGNQGQPVNGGYCSTLYAHANGLPTTAAGQCGTILVLNTGSTVRPWLAGRRTLVGLVVVMLVGLAWWI